MIGFSLFLLALYLFFSGRKKYSLFILIALSSSGFWIIGYVDNFFGLSIQLNDFALLYVFIILFYKFVTGRLRALPNELKFVNYFVIFLITSMFVDYFFNATSIGDILATSRQWLYVLFVYLIPYYTKDEVFSVLKMTAGFTVIQIALFLTEPLTGVVLFSPNGTLAALTMSGVERYAMFPPFLVFAFTWFFVNPNIVKRYKNLILILILMAVGLTLIRSLVIIIVLIFILSLFISVNQSVAKKVASVVGLLLFIFAISFYEPIASRFAESASDLNSISRNSNEVEGNMSFRLLLTAERLDYIFEEAHTTIFGMGFISEKHFRGHFIFGLPDDYGFTIQLDTADIAWALFFLRLGVLGTFLYLLIYFRLGLFFWKHKANYLALGGLYYLIMQLFLSLSGVAIAQGSFILIPALLYKLIKKGNQ